MLITGQQLLDWLLKQPVESLEGNLSICFGEDEYRSISGVTLSTDKSDDILDKSNIVFYFEETAQFVKED